MEEEITRVMSAVIRHVRAQAVGENQPLGWWYAY